MLQNGVVDKGDLAARIDSMSPEEQEKRRGTPQRFSSFFRDPLSEYLCVFAFYVLLYVKVLSHILELLEFFVYSRKEDSKYRGTLAFHFRGLKDETSTTNGQGEAGMVIYSVRIGDGKETTIYRGYPPDGVVSAYVHCGPAEFLYINSGKASARDMVRLGLQGKIWVSGFKVRECSDFASSFNLPTPYWDAFYQSGLQGKIRHTFQQGTLTPAAQGEASTQPSSRSLDEPRLEGRRKTIILHHHHHHHPQGSMRAASVLRSSSSSSPSSSSSSSLPSFPSPPSLSVQSSSAPLLQDVFVPAHRLLSSLREALHERRRQRDNTRALHDTSLLVERVMWRGSTDCSDWWGMAPSNPNPAGPTMSVAEALGMARRARAAIRERTGR